MNARYHWNTGNFKNRFFFHLGNEIPGRSIPIFSIISSHLQHASALAHRLFRPETRSLSSLHSQIQRNQIHIQDHGFSRNGCFGLRQNVQPHKLNHPFSTVRTGEHGQSVTSIPYRRIWYCQELCAKLVCRLISFS